MMKKIRKTAGPIVVGFIILAGFSGAAQARYIQADPTGFAAGPNLYSYAGQNPTQNIDPLGLANIYIGGLADKSTNGPVLSYVDLLKKNNQWGPYDAYYPHDQQSEALAYVSGLPQSEPINLYGHSYGGDTAAKVARDCPRPVNSLTTVDPVSWHPPNYNDVLANTNSWTDINNTGPGGADNVIALAGGHWGNSANISGVNYIEDPYASHASFGPSLDFAYKLNLILPTGQ